MLWGPRTRSGDSAQGVAQFMPRTAAERGLLDPFDPVQALSKSAQSLREPTGCAQPSNAVAAPAWCCAIFARRA